jgi:hypothetical protein
LERNVVISVAHCVVELGSSRTLTPVDELKVVLAPVSSVYNENVASSRAKIFNVREPLKGTGSELYYTLYIIRLRKHGFQGHMTPALSNPTYPSSNLIIRSSTTTSFVPFVTSPKHLPISRRQEP